MESNLSESSTYVAKTVVLWDYLISIDDEASAPRQHCEIAHHENVRIVILDSFSESGGSSTSNAIWFTIHLTSGTRCGNYNPTSQRLISIQIVVIQSLLVIRVWAMMDKDCRILSAFFGLLVSTMVAALALFILLDPILPEAFFEICLVAAAAYRGIKVLKSSYTSVLQQSPRPIIWLMFRDSVLCFFILITVTRMLLRLRKQALADSSGQASVEEGSLTTFRAVSGETSSEVAG
ncbi:hypothetical protein ARMGADRAFT_1034988 [Armillaria gallica]|uniref:Uncharacterized protein n=1 Tax=Armillaria gallica TaxID=47427 RepID=A0A2H3D032_ARMGA|nr:hypothetical protein ARMGADRAFT_1034988 [Armillaria gallica]